jgi:hypothetical protein
MEWEGMVTTNSQIDELDPSPRLVFRDCAGDLLIAAGDVEHIKLEYPQQAEAVSVRELEDAVEIVSVVPLTVRAPAGTAVLVESCAGNLRADDLDDMHINTHRGDLSLQRVKRIEIATVNGNARVGGGESLQVTTLNGSLSIRGVRARVAVLGVRGDVLSTDTEGQVSLQGITGDVVIDEPSGSLEARDVNGNIQFAGNLQSGQWNLEANGDVAIYLEPDSNALVDLDCPLGRIKSNLELATTEESRHRLVGSLGTGAAQLKVVAHSGDIKLAGKRVGTLRDELDTGVIRAATRAEPHAERARRRAEKLEQKARRRAERLEEKARRRAQRIEEKAHRRSERLAEKPRRWRVKWGTPQTSRQTENLEDERLAVLRMLAEGKVNAEQADALLQALEA